MNSTIFLREFGLTSTIRTCDLYLKKLNSFTRKSPHTFQVDAATKLGLRQTVYYFG